MVRMRYKRTPFKDLYTEDIIAGDDTYFVIIMIPNMEVSLVTSSGKTIKKHDADTLAQAKRWAKNELKKLGAVFYDEVRRRK